MRKVARTSRRPVKGALASAIGLLTILSAGPSMAADWSLNFRTGTDLEATDNISDTSRNKDAALKLTSTTSVDLLAKTKIHMLRLTPQVVTRPIFFANTNTQWDLFPSLGLGYHYAGKVTDFDLSAFVAQAPINTTRDLLPGPGFNIVDLNGSEFDYGTGFTWSRKLSRRDTLTWSNNFSAVDYSINSPDFESNDTYSTSLAWQRLLTKLVSGTASTSLTYYDPQRAASNNRLTISPSIGVNAQLTRRFSASVSAGFSIIDEDNLATTYGAIGTLSAAYVLKNNKFNFSVSRDFSTAQNGSLLDRYIAQFGMTHAVNDQTAWGLTSSFTYRPIDNGPNETYFAISPSLTYQLARDWDTGVSYSLSRTDKGTDSYWTNAVFFNLSYDKALLK